MILVMLLFAVEEFRIERLRKKKKKERLFLILLRGQMHIRKKKKLNA
jgi:hypothetical protein